MNAEVVSTDFDFSVVECFPMEDIETTATIEITTSPDQYCEPFRKTLNFVRSKIRIVVPPVPQNAVFVPQWKQFKRKLADLYSKTDLFCKPHPFCI